MKLIRPLLALAVLSAIVLVPALPAPAAVTGACNPPTIRPDWNDVTYKTLQDGTKVTADIFVPKGSGPFPAVVTVHGSLWKSGCKENVEVEADRTRNDGFAVFNIDTRLDCKHAKGFDQGLCKYHAIDPAIDVNDAVAWVRAHAATYKADPDHVGTLGFSTGGNLSFMAAAIGAGASRPDAAASWSGSTELGYLVDGRVSCTLSMHPDGCVIARSTYVGCSLNSCPDLWANASPYNHLDASDPPLFIANSLRDQIPYQEALDFYSLAGQLGVPAVLCTAPGGHARGYEDKTCAEDQSQTVFERTLSWLHAQLG